MSSYPLTALQQGMLAQHLRAPGSGVDIEQLVCTLPETVDVDAMRRAWEGVVARHDVLRTAIEWEGLDAPRQSVQPSVDVPFVVLDWRGLAPDERATRFDALLRDDRARGFALQAAPLLRLTLVRVAAAESRLVWTFHHAILDGRCFPMVLREVFDAYDVPAFAGMTSRAPATRRPFREYVEWLGARAPASTGGTSSESDAFWRETLAGMSAATPIPVARAVPSRETVVQGDRDRWVDAPVVAALRAMADRYGVTLNTVVQGAWALVLARYSGEDDVTFGVTRAGRRGTVPGADEMLGLFINTLPLRVRVAGDRPVGAWLGDVRAAWNALRDHEHTPLSRVHAATTVPPGQPLFDSLVMFETYELEASLQSLGGPWARRGFRLHEQNGFPLTLAAYASERMLLRLEFDRTRFDDDAVERMLGHLATALEAMAADPEAPVAAVSILPAAERAQVLHGWAGETVTYTGGDTLVALLAAQAARTPNAIAVTDERRTLTYAQLAAATTALARRLRAAGVGRGVLVGVCAERSVELVIALVAAVQAGGAYVPIDPEYPADRVAYMLADAGVRVLLTTAALAPTLPAHGATVMLLDGAAEAAEASEAGEPLPLPAADDPAYMIYTSGSTGRPKGALNAHRGIVNRLQWMQSEYALGAGDVVLQKTPFSFDVSVWEFFWPLMTGATLVLAWPGGHRDTTYLADTIARQGVTVCHFVPSMLRAFLADQQAAGCTTLRDVMASGEALAPDLVAAFYTALPNARLHNLYGPTECAVDVSYWPCPPSVVPPAVVPIGRAVANTRLYVLDPRGEPTPIGVPGELFLAGVQVGLGYHGRPELTAEKFVVDRFGGEALIHQGLTSQGLPNPRMYRTGDRARWLADGTVEYLGRLDFQVKVRGFRIELGEIEATLLTHASVRDCVVTAREGEGGEKRLVAYAVVGGEPPAVSTLRAFLSETLPDHMVPGAFVFLDALPLSSNGKVDRRALPDPQLDRGARTRVHEAPRTDAERALAEIWARVLRVERVGVTDDFFELGGDSLLSIQIVSQAARAGLRLTLTQVLQQPTVAAQARVAPTVAPTGAPNATPHAAFEDVIGTVPLTPVQQWFFEGQREQAHYWNQAFIFTVPSGFDAVAFGAAIDAVTRQHDSLRLRYERAGDAWRQRCVSAGDPSLRSGATVEVHDLGALPEGTRCDAMAEASVRVQGSLDLAQGPLLRAALFRLTPGRTERLLIAVHHLAIDGVSWRVLREDLEAAYVQRASSASAGEPTLPARTTSFGQWAAQLAAPAVRDALRGERAYWEQAGAAGARLPRDIEGQGEDYAAYTDTVVVRLDAAETRALLQAVPAAYNTQINDALLAALAPALAGMSAPAFAGVTAEIAGVTAESAGVTAEIGGGTAEIVVNVEGHGREDAVAGADLSRTLGWFTTIFPVRLPLGAASVDARLKETKERLRAVPGRGFGYGVLRYLDGLETLRAQPTPDVVFNYMGQFDQVLAGSTVFGYTPDGTGSWYGPRTRRRHLLEINAMVIDGRLEVRWSFSGRAHHRETIARVADAYVAALRDLIAHCTASDAGGYTPSDFPLARLDQAALDRLLTGVTGARDVADVYPVTPLQRLFLDASAVPAAAEGTSHRDPGFQQYVFELAGDVDADALGEAWQAVVRRHDVLRTRFAIGPNAAPLQIVQRHAAMPWRVDDRRGGVDTASRLTAFLRDDRARGFDVARAPLMRATLIRTDDARWTLVWTQHHLLLDRWSWPIVLREVGMAYDARRRPSAALESTPLPAAVPFRDYVAWLQAQPARSAESYWREELADVGEPLRLLAPTSAGVTSAASDVAWDEVVVELTADETVALRQATRTRGLAANVAVQGAWAVALAHLGDRDDVTYGLAVAGRGVDVAGIESMVGVTINNVPVRARLDLTAPASEWLAGLQRRQAALRAAEHASLEEIQRWSGIPWRHRLFESLLVFQDRAAETGMAGWLGPTTTLRAVATPTETAYPITVLVTGDDRLTLTLLCDRRQVPRSLGEQLAAGTLAALRTMAAGLDAPVADVRSALPPVRPYHDVAVMVERVAPRTATEAVLVRIWSELLGVPDLGVTDNFLARGGHSLLATQIVSRVRETLHLDVPVRALFQAPTVAEFARALAALERKPGQVERIAQLVQRIDGMSADELRQATAARDGRARQTATVHGD